MKVSLPKSKPLAQALETKKKSKSSEEAARVSKQIPLIERKTIRSGGE